MHDQNWDQKLFSRLEGVREIKPGREWEALCPVHEADGGRHTPSLALTLKAEPERILLCCRAGCTNEAILAALGIKGCDLFRPKADNSSAPRNGHTPRQAAHNGKQQRRIVTTYPYTDETGNPLYEVVRYEPKDFSQRRPDGNGGYAWNLKGVRRVLYRLPEVLEAIALQRVIFLVEGEKDADTLRALDLTATTCAQGAKGWKPQYNYSETLRCADAIILPDNDQSGRELRDAKGADLQGKAARVRVLELPGLPPKGDVSDWLAAGGTKEELLRLAAEAPLWIQPACQDDDRQQGQNAPNDPTRNLTDLGNAERLIDAHGEDLRYCHRWAQWLVWNGKYWQVDMSGEIRRRAKATVRSILAEAAACTDDEMRRALVKHATASEQKARIASMIDLARSERGVPVEADSLDRDGFLLCCQNGTLDLRTGILRPHQREDLITRSIPVPYDPSAMCPHWHAHLERFLPDPEIRTFLRRAVGYTLTGDISERVIFIMHGTGSNGKSVMIETLAEMMGKYSMRTPVETLMVKRDGGIPNDVARLKGARLVHASETEEGKRLAESFIKELTGGDTMSARFMRGEWFDFKPELKLWLRTNHKPVIRGTDQAIWDRLPLIPFNVRIAEHEKRPLRDVMSELRAEMPGILAWAVQGCQEWLKTGLDMPAAVRTATSEYRAEMDTIAAFIGKNCICGPKCRASANALYTSYQKWCADNGEQCNTQKKFGGSLTERGFVKTKQGTIFWLGIGIIDPGLEG